MWPTHYIPNQPRVEGVPPPRYYLTTLLYPLNVVEELESQQGIPDLGFSPSADVDEAFQSSGAVLSGVIKSILIQASVPPDNVWSNGAVISGVLAERLIRVDIGNDRLESTAAVLSGHLGDPLVRYENWPLGVDSEDLISAGLPVSGALT